MEGSRESSGAKSDTKRDRKGTPGSRKRVVRACDECRLHKAKCDGAKLCAACVRYERECTYNLLASESKGSAERIRILEDRLARARACIAEMKRLSPQLAQASTYTSGPFPSSISSASQSPGSIISPVHNATSSFSTGSALTTAIVSSLETNDLFDNMSSYELVSCSSPFDENVGYSFCQLPAHDVMIELIEVTFREVFALSNIVSEQAFRHSAQRLYDRNSLYYTSEDRDFQPLFSVVIALGLLFHTDLQGQLGYEKVKEESLRFLQASIPRVAEVASEQTMLQLRTTLCTVLYLSTTSCLQLAYDCLRGVCNSPMTVALFDRITSPSPSPQIDAVNSEKDLAWTITYLDLHLSGLLGLPMLRNAPGPEIATIHAINTAAYNVGNCIRSDRSFLLSVALAMQIELLKLMRRMMPLCIAGVDVKLEFPIYGTTSRMQPLDIKTAMLVQAELETWQAMFLGIFPAMDGTVQPLDLLRTRQELEMYFHMAQIMLFQGSLAYHSQSPARQSPLMVDHVQKGIACVMSARTAITSIATHFDPTQSTTMSWLTTHVIFLSVVCLLVASSTAEDTERLVLENNIAAGIQLVSQTTCGSMHSKQYYLDYIQNLAAKTRTAIDSTGPPSCPSLVSSTSAASDSFLSDDMLLEWWHTGGCQMQPQPQLYYGEHFRQQNL